MRSAVRAVPGVSSWTPSAARKSRAARAAASSRGASVSREQAARAAGVPVHRAKFHLDRLEAEGLLRSSYARTSGRTGPGDALERTARVLADLGYEPHRALDRLELANCPFHALAQDETELVCGLNHCFVSGLAEETASGELDARLEPDPQPCCVVVHRTSG